MPLTPPEEAVPRLPAPSAAAQAHSRRVVAHLVRTIAEAGGWISFADYMGEALYAPGLGYYAAGTRKFGAAGDYVTAPELTPLFGAAVTTQLAQVLGELGNGEIIELGPGTGRLAADILAAMAQEHCLPDRYRLLEVSPELRERQHVHLAEKVPDLAPRVDWIDRLPERWYGVVIANEVLDSVPPHLVRRSGGAWLERGVAVDEEGRLAFADRPLAAGSLLDAAQGRFPIVEGDYLSEVNPAAEALVRALAQRCGGGALLVIDYGFPAPEYYHPQRTAGTLMTHYRHRSLDDPFLWPGLADLTAHVDFTAMAHAGVAAGMSVGGYASQARFLLNCGLLNYLARTGDPQSTAYLREAAAAHKLTSPAEMGELFKVLALVRGVEAGLVGFREGDQSHRL
jgi:SAM-dependent MidA family methyltransferase